jgi:DNA-binding IclR family transcriptional regulator
MPSNGGLRETQPIQSLDRGLMILEAVANAGDPVSLSDLTSLVGIDRSSVFRLANTLKRRGFLAYPAGRKDFILGPALWRLSHRYDWGTMLIRVSQPYLKQLSKETNETAIREGRNALFIDHVTANHVIAVSGQTGEMVPLHCTAHGKALLLGMPRTELLRTFGAESLPVHTKQTIATVTELTKVCADMQVRGYATDEAEYREGLRCVAAPIMAQKGMIVGSIGVSAPVDRFPKSLVAETGAKVRATADEISARLCVEPQDV